MKKLLFILSCSSTWLFAQKSGVFEITKFGAKTSSPNNAVAIQKAIDACHRAGGGKVIVPSGTFLTGGLILKSNVELHLSIGAVLKGSPRMQDYFSQRPSDSSFAYVQTDKSILYAEKVENIAITGFGTIDGNGKAPDFELPSEGKQLYKDTLLKRPMIIRFIACKNIRIENITLQNSANWVQHYMGCEYLSIRNMKVHSFANRNNDGLDIDNCRFVTVSDCIIDSDDDALCLKSESYQTCQNISITNCILSSNCNAIKFGTSSLGGFRDITISNCIIRAPSQKSEIWQRQHGLAGLALEMVDGGTMEGITINNITMDSIMTPIFIRLGNRARKLPEAPIPSIGSLKNINISNIFAKSIREICSVITGIPNGMVENVQLSTIHLVSNAKGTVEDYKRTIPEAEAEYPENKMFGHSLPAYGLYIRHAKGIVLADISLETMQEDVRPAIYCDDVIDLTINGFYSNPKVKSNPLIHFTNVQQAKISNSNIAEPIEVFLKLDGEKTRNIRLNNNYLERTNSVYEVTPNVPKENLLIVR
ncbi:MAG: glycosyl hydrolase family 28 protein [Cytophagales bacterium]|nr:glycosyl hydrolase family 28 protein [Cytophagales bacterium]MDW8383827.1 glycosyl hydrolase family 28 protein [Flammeovirgaceae bacterium]